MSSIESQYFLDINELGGEPDDIPQGVETHTLALHFSNLFDQNDDESGERYDLSTGESYINDCSRMPLGMSSVLTDTLIDAGLLLDSHSTIQEEERLADSIIDLGLEIDDLDMMLPEVLLYGVDIDSDSHDYV